MTDSRERILIYDTTLRDGAQAEEVSLSLEDKLLIAEKLDEIGVDYVEGGYPLSNPKDKAFFEEVPRRGLRHAKVAAFGMTRRKGVKAADDAGMAALLESAAPVVTIVGKSWFLHVRDVLAVSEQENLDMIGESLALMASEGREAIFDAEHFFDGYRASPAFALKTLSAAAQAGASTLVLCDTNGGNMPEFIARVVTEVRGEFPDITLGIHCHNDSAVAVACSLAAVAAGATHVQGTINGIGERCGNADLTAVAANLVLKYGRACLAGGALRKLTEVSRFVSETVNLLPLNNQPYVGMAAFAHKGGMHVHAVQRNPASYEHVDPAAVGNRRRVLISELSGASNVAAKAAAKFDLEHDKALQRKVLERVQDMENAGYHYEAAEASFELLVRKVLGGQWYRSFWELNHYRCVILEQNRDRPVAEATVKLHVGKATVHEVAEGDGPVDALAGALWAALRRHYPSVDALHLADYKVRVVNPSAGTAAKVRVVIEFHDERSGYFSTIGVDENIIHASWEALTEAIQYKLLNEAEAGGRP